MVNPGRRCLHEVVPCSFALLLLEELASFGAAAEPGLARLPVSVAGLRAQYREGIPAPLFSEVYGECITAIAELVHQRRGVTFMSRNDVEMLCYCLVSCETLQEAIDRARRFYLMLGNRGAALDMEVCGGQATFHLRTQQALYSRGGLLVDLTGLLFLYRLFSWLINREIPAADFGICYPELINAELLRTVFHQTIHFDKVSNCFRFPAEFLDYPVVRSPQRLREMLSTLRLDMNQDPAMSWCLSDAVERIILAHLSAGKPMPSLKELAGLFNISTSTFRRRLKEESSPLSTIKEACRLTLATELLSAIERPKIEEIALRLGFSDARGFRRAFKARTGMSPDTYRTSQI